MRDDDIPDLVQEDVCDLGIVGLNVLEEKRLEFASHGHPARFESVRSARFRPLPARARHSARSAMEGSRIGARASASPPPTLSSSSATSATAIFKAEIVTLSGAVEIAPRLKRADLICDLVASGSTLEANHLKEVETVLESHAVLIRTPKALLPEKEDWVRRLLMRIDGVQQVRESKYIMLHAPRSALPEISRLLPGSESPTIIPLEGSPDRVAVHAVCRENVFWETLERLKQAGASAAPRAPGREDACLTIMRILDWKALDEPGRRAALARPAPSGPDAQRVAFEVIERRSAWRRSGAHRADAPIRRRDARFA